MSSPVTVAIVLATPHGLQHIVGAEERDVAGPAEACLRALKADARGTSFWVQTRDLAARERLTGYLWQVKREVLAEAQHDMS